MTDIRYPDYESLELDWPEPHVLRVTLSRGRMNSLDFQMHRDLSSIWRLIDEDPEVSAVVLAGKGRAYSAGGDFDMVQRIIDDYDFRCQMWKEGRALVRNMLDCGKPIVSAISGAAAGGGLATALLADGASQAAPPSSWTGTPPWAWPPTTMRSRYGRCCADCPRRSTT
nr:MULTISPECIES: enoyl-CoA hydratase-related protein [Protofrankia]